MEQKYRAPEILFARIDAKEIQPKVDAIQAKQKEEYEKEQKALNGRRVRR